MESNNNEDTISNGIENSLKPSRTTAGGRSPIPPNSPLLNRTPESPQLARARKIHREMTRAKGFRASLSRESSRAGSRCGTPTGRGSRCGTPSRNSRCATPSKGSRAGSPEEKGEDVSVNGIPINKMMISGEVSFAIRPSLGARKGWKIMPESGGDAIEDPELLQRVVDMIKDMEFSGHSVPERITIKV